MYILAILFIIVFLSFYIYVMYSRHKQTTDYYLSTDNESIEKIVSQFRDNNQYHKKPIIGGKAPSISSDVFSIDNAQSVELIKSMKEQEDEDDEDARQARHKKIITRQSNETQ